MDFNLKRQKMATGYKLYLFPKPVILQTGLAFSRPRALLCGGSFLHQI
jgi:hypothetical protein